jgi:hypothetical protein
VVEEVEEPALVKVSRLTFRTKQEVEVLSWRLGPSAYASVTYKGGIEDWQAFPEERE